MVLDGALMERAASMGTLVIDSKKLSIVTKDRNPLRADFNQKTLAVVQIIHRGDTILHPLPAPSYFLLYTLSLLPSSECKFEAFPSRFQRLFDVFVGMGRGYKKRFKL